MRHLPALTLLALASCAQAPPTANPEFSDALRFAFGSFYEPEEELAYALRNLEASLYTTLDVEADSPQDRAITPEHLVDADIEGLDHPDEGDLFLALPVAVAGASPWDLEQHVPIQLLVDQTPVEPLSPDYYERTFFEGQDCWGTRECDVMKVRNDLIKDNFLMTIPYYFLKDFRWVDMNLPSPDDLEEGVEPTSDASRYAYIARSWMPEVAVGEGGGTTIVQFYALDVWFPRDGQGWIRESSDQNAGEGEWTSDSSGGGTLRVLVLWSQTEFDGISFTDDQIAATTRGGIDDIFSTADDWIEAQQESGK